MDFKNFKKVHEDDGSAVMQNDVGHKIHIVKSALSTDLLKRLKALPLHQAMPDDAVPPAQVSGQPTPPANSEDPYAWNILSATSGGTPVSPSTTPIQTGPSAISPEFAPSPSLNVPPSATSTTDQTKRDDLSLTPTGDYVGAMPGGSEAREAIGLHKEAEEEAASGEEGARQGYQDFLDKDIPQFKKDTASLLAERDAVAKDIADNKISASQYMDSKGTLGKVSTAIGLILGGIGSGLTGGSNVALDFLNKQIDRNLDAQRLDLGRKQNLLTALDNQYHNSMVRDNMFRSIHAEALANQIGQARASAMTPQAQSNALMAQSQLKQQSAQWFRQAQLAHMQDWVQGAPSGQAGQDARADQYLRVSRVLAPDQAKEFESRYIPGVGVSSVPLEPKDRETLQKKTELQSMLNEADDYLKQSGTMAVMPEFRAKGTALQNRINLRMGELADLTRFTPEENKIYQRSVPDLTGTHFTGSDQALLDGLRQENNDSLNTFYKQKGLKVAPAGSEERVTVIAPSGKSGTISRGNLKSAVAQGYKQVQ